MKLDTVKAPFYIIALQRTGTNYLGSIVRNTGNVQMYGEVLYPDLSDENIAQGIENGLFFPFYKLMLQENWQNLLFTDSEIRKNVFHRFFAHLLANTPLPIVGVDIKYEQSECYPGLLKDLSQWGFRCVHLVRRNYLARIVSHQVLMERVRAGNSDVHLVRGAVPPIRLDPQYTVQWMLADEGRNNFLRSILDRADLKYMQIAYEDIQPDADGQATLRALFAYLGLDDATIPTATTVKQREADLAAQVINYDEVLAEIDRQGARRLLAESSPAV